MISRDKILKAVSQSLKMEGLSLERAMKNKEIIKLLNNKSMMNFFMKKKKKIETIPRLNISSDVKRSVRVENKDGSELKPEDMNEEELRMADLLSTISMAAKTGKYTVCISIYDPEKKLKRTRGNIDIHHFTFCQDFPSDDRYGCLDEYAKLLKLGDK